MRFAFIRFRRDEFKIAKSLRSLRLCGGLNCYDGENAENTNR